MQHVKMKILVSSETTFKTTESADEQGNKSGKLAI